MKKLLISLSLILSLNNAVAAECDPEKDALVRAAEYIKLLEERSELERGLVRSLQLRNEGLQQDLAELEARNQAWYNSPFMMLAIGVLAGAAVTK